MENAGLTRSMSKKGCSPDNSACEGFFGRLKNEMFYGRSWKDVTIEEFIRILDEYIHWYAEKKDQTLTRRNESNSIPTEFGTVSCMIGGGH